MHTSAVGAIVAGANDLVHFCNLQSHGGKKLGERAGRMKTVLRNDIAGHLTVLLPPGRH